MKNSIIPSVNFHLWEPCNMRCKFCFATFQDVKRTVLPKGHLTQQEAKEVVKRLAEDGFEKITFAGGEPTLCPWLGELILTAKNLGMTTMIVTNGTRLDDKYLSPLVGLLDWVAISIDSLNIDVNLKTGRAITGKRAITSSEYLSMTKRVKDLGFGLKINTVVNRFNLSEDFGEFIKETKPNRWKILQTLPIEGQNDKGVDEMLVSGIEFEAFISRHRQLQHATTIVSESNDEMTGSYMMVDPAGRFFDNVSGSYVYSSPILEAGVPVAMNQVRWDMGRFISREGIYDWENKS